MATAKHKKIKVGLGLRRENSEELLQKLPPEIDCLEIAPENYMQTGGKIYRQLRELAEHYPIFFHGLSLSVGSIHPLDKKFLKDLKPFLKQFRAPYMTDHLCYSSVFGAQFHDLLPLPFSREAVRHVVPRIRQIQDYLEMPFAVENVSYYAPGGPPEMTEWEFLSEVAERADCSILLDVNNVYVNSVNHQFDPREYLKNVPLDRVIHMHIAGHMKYQGFLLDNHGAPVIDPVWDLLRFVAPKIEASAMIVERDNDVPPVAESIAEVKIAKKILDIDRRGDTLCSPSIHGVARNHGRSQGYAPTGKQTIIAEAVNE